VSVKEHDAKSRRSSVAFEHFAQFYEELSVIVGQRCHVVDKWKIADRLIRWNSRSRAHRESSPRQDGITLRPATGIRSSLDTVSGVPHS
jgi:hypothetical protein